MASKRDLVEAHTFNRKRLVSAFVGGAPGGRELDPSSPTRPVVVGLVLALLLVGGAALTGFLKPTLPSGWEDNTLVVGKDTGARYISRDGVLYPVVNVASARLLVPSGEFQVVFVPDEQLNDRPKGPTVGIVGAPETLPAPDALVQDRWTSCVDQYGQTRLRITAEPKVQSAPANAAYYVRTDDGLSVITAGRRYPVAKKDRHSTLAALGLVDSNPVDVPGRWADLFPAGHDLRPVTVREAGLPVPRGMSLPPDVPSLGAILELPAVGDGQTRYYLVRRAGLLPLTEVAMALYRVAADPGLRAPIAADISVLARNKVLPDTWARRLEWPTRVPAPLTDEVVCAHLRTGVPGEELPEVSLALPRDTLVGTAASDAAPANGEDVLLDAGRGALVRAVSGGSNRGTVYLVDAQGTAYAVDGEYALDQLGYGQVLPRSVPASWVEFLEGGTELSYAALRRSAVAGGGSGGR